jgi:ribonuclease-3
VKKRQATEPDLQELAEIVAYEFQDSHLLERAITHRSWAHEQVAPGSEEEARRLHNEALEFIGDSVLGLVVANHLFLSNPNITEGELSRMKHRLVSAATLCRAAKEMRFGEFLRLGVGEEKTGGRGKRALLADVFEAILGAIFLDGGLQAATDFVMRALGAELETADPEQAAAADYKTLLQERLQAAQGSAPQYTVVETDGPPHRRIFHVEVNWEGGSVRGAGRTIKAAETHAARLALERMNESGTAQAAD